MYTSNFEKERKIVSQLADQQLKDQQLSHNPSRNQNSISPVSRGITSPQSYFSSGSYQRAFNISPSLEIQSKIHTKQNPLILHQKTYEKRYFPKQNEAQMNENRNYTQFEIKNKATKDPMKQITLLKSKIKEEQFLIELQNAVHKELMSILSKKDKSLALMKDHKIDPNTCYEIEEQTESFLDKAESYVKEMKKLSQMTNQNSY